MSDSKSDRALRKAMKKLFGYSKPRCRRGSKIDKRDQLMVSLFKAQARKKGSSYENENQSS